MKDLLDGQKILVVDDEEDILDTLEELLPMCELEKVRDFQSAKGLLEKKSFDLAILDIMGVDGYDLLEIAKNKDITTIILTAHAFSPEDTAKSIKSGADYYIPKDFLFNIQTYLRDVLEAKKARKNPWGRWKERFYDHYNRRFGESWKDADQELWSNIMHYTPNSPL
jgi:DNA-binding response OmpR family regulator